MNEILAHTVILVVGIAAYAVLVITGNDGTPVLTAVVGYSSALGISKATNGKK